MNREQAIACVQQSPAAVAEKNKARWLALFADQASVEDPVGSEPHTNADARANFWDAFIAPNGIEFDVQHDTVCGQEVWRDLSIHIQLSSRCRIVAPMHLRYCLAQRGDELAIERLQAYWEMSLLTKGVLTAGPAGWWAGTRMFVGILKRLGLGGALGFMRGMRSHGLSAKRQMQQHLQLLRQGDLLGDAKVKYCHNGAELDARGMQALLKHQRWDKWIACGSYCTGSLLPREQADSRRGIVRGEFDSSGKLIALAAWLSAD